MRGNGDSTNVRKFTVEARSSDERENQYSYTSTVMILSFWTDIPWQTVQTQIRLLLEEQSDQGLHCLPFRLNRLDSILYGRAT